MTRPTPPTPMTPLSDDEVHALVDGQVPPADVADLQARLAHDPTAQARVLHWQQQRQWLKGLHQPVLEEPVPTVMQATAQNLGQRQSQQQQWQRWGGMAAGVALSFGLGWLTHGQWRNSPTMTSPPMANATPTTPAVRDFVRQASVAHAVYTPELRHPVEVAAADQAHLVQWLSKRLGKPLQVPQLDALGYALVGGRLLPGDQGARAQFMFQNTAGTRITLYLGVMNPAAPGHSASQATSLRETAFSFAQTDGVPSFYWVNQGFGYALAGQVPQSELMQLATAVYRQL